MTTNAPEPSKPDISESRFTCGGAEGTLVQAFLDSNATEVWGALSDLREARNDILRALDKLKPARAVEPLRASLSRALEETRKAILVLRAVEEMRQKHRG